MREFVITVNSTVDLPKEWLKERNVPVLPLKYTIDGQTYQDMEGLSAKEFFQKLREGHMSVTSQINPEEAREMMEPFLKEGKDLLHRLPQAFFAYDAAKNNFFQKGESHYHAYHTLPEPQYA